MQRSKRVREKREIKPSLQKQQAIEDSIQPPENYKFIISPYICFYALDISPYCFEQNIDAVKAIKDLLFRQQNLAFQFDLIQKYQKQLKLSFSQLDKFWVNKSRSIFKRLSKYPQKDQFDEIKNLMIENQNYQYSFRQAYFDKNPKQKYAIKNPLNDKTVHSIDIQKGHISFKYLEQEYDRVIDKWESYIRSQKKDLIRFYERLLYQISGIVEMKLLQQLPLSST